MGGASLQLIAEATENNYLTGNPQITFFKSVYRRHTNFAIESRKLNFTSKPDFGDPVNCRIPKGPDLLHKLYLYVEIPEINVDVLEKSFKAFRWLNWLGHSIIKNSSISIGQTIIDEQDGEWLHIWNELSQKEGKKHAYAEMVGNVPDLTQIHTVRGMIDSPEGDVGTNFKLTDARNLYIPLQFWFCKNPGQALPLIALEKAEVMVDIEFEELEELIWASEQIVSGTGELYIADTGGGGTRINTVRNSISTNIFQSNNKPSLRNAFIYADYIYLDNDEKKRFTNNRHEYLIEKIQTRGTSFTSVNSQTHKVDLNFFNPVKELIWRIRPVNLIDKRFCQSRGGMQRYNYTDKYDFTGYTGVPSPKGGCGLVGGRTNENFFTRLPAAKLSYKSSSDPVKTRHTPNFLDNSLSSSTSWDGLNNQLTDITSLGITQCASTGFDFISQYFNSTRTDTNEVENSVYRNFTMAHMFNFPNPIQDNTTLHVPDENGLWNRAGSNNPQRITYNGDNPTKNASLFLNGVRRFDEREGFYFNVIQPYQHHTNVPCSGINVYSFAIDPEDHQPSGTCNFSKISDAEIIITLTEEAQKVVSEVKVYAVSYNILRIKDNTAEIAFAR